MSELKKIGSGYTPVDEGGKPLPSIGRIVHYVNGAGTHLPAMIHEVGQSGEYDHLIVFERDGRTFPVQCFHGYEGVGYWHWPERV